MPDVSPDGTIVSTYKNVPDRYFGLHRHPPPVAAGEQMLKNLGTVFEKGKCQFILYIDVNKKRRCFLDWCEKVEYDKSVTHGALKENSDYLRANIDGWSLVLEVIHGDVLDPGCIPRRFVMSFFWYGPKYLEESEIETVPGNLEIISCVVVFEYSYDAYMQRANYGNSYKKHPSQPHPLFLEQMGYTIDTIDRADEASINMLAWKFMAMSR